MIADLTSDNPTWRIVMSARRRGDTAPGRLLREIAARMQEPWREYTNIGRPDDMPPKRGNPTALAKLALECGADPAPETDVSDPL